MKQLSRLEVIMILLLFITSGAACANHYSTIGDVKDIDFEMIDEVQIQTKEQVEKLKACERYEITGDTEVFNFISMFTSSKMIEKMKTPFPLGDGVISLTLEGVPYYAFRYYLDQEQLLDLHKGILYETSNELSKMLINLESLPTVNKCNGSVYLNE